MRAAGGEVGDGFEAPRSGEVFLLPWPENQPWEVSVPCGAAFAFISLQVEILF
jgi:hypothetical protein